MRGYDLVALVFAREVSDPLTSLVKSIDEQLDAASVGRRGPNKLGVFVVFCNNDTNLKQQLRELAVEEELKQVVLSTTTLGGPPRYRVASEADLTVVVYANRSRVSANFPLKKGELTSDRAAQILQAIGKVLPKQ